MAFERAKVVDSWLKVTLDHKVQIQDLHCSQPSILSYFYLIVEYAEGIARELDASTKWKTWLQRGGGGRGGGEN